MGVNVKKLSSLLQNFVASTSDIQGAALVTHEGLAVSTALPTRLDEERVAAVSAATLSLGERICSELQRGITERVIIEGGEGFTLLMRCSEDLVFVVMANQYIKLGVLMYEIKRLLPVIKKILVLETEDKARKVSVAPANSSPTTTANTLNEAFVP